MSGVGRVISWPLIGLIYLYRVTLGPFVGRQCRFEPSCSHYAEDALRTQPLGRAVGLIARRLGRCHPLSRGGYDPVPITDDPVQPAEDGSPIDCSDTKGTNHASNAGGQAS